MTGPLSSDEQRAQLGRIRRKPRYVDMFRGEVSEAPPKRGNGSHVVLKPLDTERPAVPGMASWAGGGPEGKRCEHCQHLGAVTIQRPNGEKDSRAVACLKFCQRTGHLPPVRDIRLERACDQFKEGKAGDWLIDWDGKTHEPDWRDHKGVARFHLLQEHEDPERPGHLRPPSGRRSP